MKALTKLEAKTKLENILERLISTPNLDDMLDDGADSGDAKQNGRFVNVCSVVNAVHQELVNLEFDFLSSEECDSIWEEAWDDYSDPKLPEDRYNHAIRYANRILAVLNK